eukprot:s3140_g1.t1
MEDLRGCTLGRRRATLDRSHPGPGKRDEIQNGPYAGNNLRSIFQDIPEGGDFTEDDLEGSSSMYDPEVRRREMEKEEQQREEEERLRREQEQAEQARKQKEIEEANRRLAAERKRKLEEC